MRYIPLHDRTPDADWQAKAVAVIDELKNTPNAEARHKIIDDNSAIWRELKEWLLALSHGKCWFSEAKDCFSHFEVDHYRPKKSAKELDGRAVEGYWWLAFDWQNLRVCGNAGNRKKGTYFPLRTGCPRCGPFGELRYEDPQLLDPASPSDPELLSFNIEGHALPAPEVSAAWEKARAEYSVERYNLDFPPLMDKRKTVWAECWDRIRHYRGELECYNADPSNQIAREGLKQAAKRIREMMHEERELSSVARACVISSGDPRVLRLLQTI